MMALDLEIMTELIHRANAPVFDKCRRSRTKGIYLEQVVEVDAGTTGVPVYNFQYTVHLSQYTLFNIFTYWLRPD